MKIDKQKHCLDIWFDKGNKLISLISWKRIRKNNFLEYGNDPDVNIKRRWGIRTNGAEKGNPRDTCLDWTLDLGHLSINYINFNYNKGTRKMQL